MKKIILIITSLILFSNCSAQTVNLESRNGWESGKYYKDINNALNTFTGSYLYSNGNTTFEIILEKKIASNRNNVFTEDILIGAYRYVENGIEKCNTLSTLNTTLTDGRLYTINGNSIMNGKWRCPECGLNEKWIDATIIDPVTSRVHSIFLRRNFMQQFGVESMNIYILPDHFVGAIEEGDTLPQNPLFPISQWITLIKQ